jgi:hypothetical protein
MDKYESIHGKDISSFDFTSTRELSDGIYKAAA